MPAIRLGATFNAAQIMMHCKVIDAIMEGKPVPHIQLLLKHDLGVAAAFIRMRIRAREQLAGAPPKFRPSMHEDLKAKAAEMGIPWKYVDRRRRRHPNNPDVWFLPVIKRVP